ncbi:MAG: carboxypeptidase regulatory-like domain-containing protein [Vicinamibacterales bacterium]
MRRIVAALVCVVLLPSIAYAQASMTGVVRDTSGAVLPGVTIEAASPALIEKVRAAVTDGNGRYQIVDLRPGAYTVTFTLTGFNTVLRDGITLQGTAAAVVDADLRVGALSETITVTGEAPTVDVSSSTTQRVMTTAVIDSLPVSRNFDAIASMVPGVTASGANAARNQGNVVGGSSGDGIEFHGTVNSDTRVTVAGISVMTLQAGGGLGRSHPDVATASEVTVDTSSVSAELPTGGVRMNFIPRDGGNDLKGTAVNSYTRGSLQGSNYTDRLKGLGLAAVGDIDYNWDLNGGFGGPFKRDKVWFWFAGRKQLLANNATVYENANAYKPNEWLYVPSDQIGQNKGRYSTTQLRTTFQATPRNKVAFTYKYDGYCQCPGGIGATVAPEAGPDERNPRLSQEHLEWTSPVTNRLLFEAVAMHLYERWGAMQQQPRGSLDDPAKLTILPQMISVTEQSTGLTYRNLAQANNTLVPNYATRAAVAYVTGSHSLKFGINDTWGFADTRNYTPSDLPISYTFNRGVPTSITLRARPYNVKTQEDMDLGLFIQDRWTMNRITLNGALRFDYLKTSAPEQTVTPSPLTPNRNITFPQTDILAWKDVTFRSGFVWDLQGDGKTAVKVAVNKFLNGQTLNTIGSAPAPVNAMLLQTTRSWNDRGGLGINGDYIPQCDLIAPAANGECGALAASNFGQTIPATSYDPKLLSGFGVRPYNYEFSAAVNRELMPRVSVELGYFRRIWGNFQVTDNRAVSAADYDRFSIVAPSDARLPDGGGYTVNGLYDLKPTSFGRPADNYVTLSDNYGKQTYHWQGVDINFNLRPRGGLTVQGGIATGKTSTDTCAIVTKIPEMLVGVAGAAPVNLFLAQTAGMQMPDQYCAQQTPYVTQVKFQTVYLIPKIDVQLSSNFASTQGPLVYGNYTATNADVQASLGRVLAGGAPNKSVNIVYPGELYGERLQMLDLSIGKVVRLGGSRRMSTRLDFYNFLNRDTPVAVNNNYAAFMRPTDIVPARFAKITLTYDF